MATTISYAQAAKGLSSGPTSSAAPSKPPSGSATPAKETLASTTSAAAVMSWADDAEANDTRSEKTSSSYEPRTQPQVAAQKAPTASQASTTSLVSSPDLGASSASTVAKDDDVSSIPNTSSDSTWENKSQASTSVEKSVDSVEKMSENASENAAGKSSEKMKPKNAERAPAKPLQEAPIPVVNIWKQRAESAKAKPKLSPAKPATPTHGAPQSSLSTAKQTMTAVTTVIGEPKEKASASEGGAGGRGETKVSQARKDSKPEADFDKARRMTKGRQQEKETQSAPVSFPLPPNRDREAWPTPETALDEDRKKAHEKPEKERKDSPASKPSGKREWVNMAITPNVIFNTPLPNAAGSRRGGRGAARGGTHGGGRAGGFNASGVGHAEKDGSAPASLPNGDQPKRGRPDGFVREASPKEKRTVSAGSLPPKEKPATANGEKPLKVTTSEAEAPSGRTSIILESDGQVQGQNNTFTRQYAPRAGKGRRGDFVGQDRRKDSESVSPTKENGVHHERRTSNVTQTEAPEDGERRASNFTDGQPPHQSKRGSNDRQFGSFSRGERNRGGTRGGRSNYQNGHQYANGHLPSLKNSSTYPGPLSPTSFNPDPNAYFAPPPGRFRNGPRSQSVTESMYRVPGQYGGPQQVPPIQTYVNGMYDFPMVQPMSAVPYGSYGMDHHTLFSMVSTQLEYYFSLENLLKDMYLRKQMDSKGFVFFSVIAGFNRIKQLTTDPDLIKLVCYQSSNIEFRIGNDGKERLRLQEGWEQWVLPMAQRDPLAQNDGPEEVYNPPIPHPPGFDQNALPRYPEMPAGSPTGPAPFDNQGLYPAVNGFHPGAPQHVTMQPNDNLTNGETAEGVNGTATPNGHPVDISTKAVSGEPDSFSDEQVESLTVVVRKRDQSQLPALPLSVTRTFSNASLDSRSGAPDEFEKLAGRQASVRTNGTGPSLGDESKLQHQPRRNPSPFVPPSALNPVRLYWVKDNDAPVDFVPPDSTHESYYFLRSKALQQRQNTSPGCCPYDMDVLYQFWSHFLIRNFNTRMYDEFRHFAFDDAANNLSEVGLTNLIKFYGESLLSSQNIIRKRVAQDYVDLVQSENQHRHLAFYQLQSAFRNSALEPRNRNRITDLLDAELRTSLE